MELLIRTHCQHHLSHLFAHNYEALRSRFQAHVLDTYRLESGSHGECMEYCKYIDLMALQYGLVFTVRCQTLEREFFCARHISSMCV